MMAQDDFLSQLGSLSSGVGLGHCRPESTWCRPKSTWADFKWSRTGRCRVESAWFGFDRSRHRPMSIRVDQGRSHLVSAWAKVDYCRPGLILKVDMGRCRTNSIRVDVEQIQSGFMSIGVDPGRCRAELDRVDVEGSLVELMTKEISPGRCRSKSTRANVEWSRPGSM